MSHRIRRFSPSDREAMLAFADGLPEHDLLFIRRDLKHPRVVDAWQQGIVDGRIDSLTAEDDGVIVGTVALIREPLGWSTHVGEIRLLVAPDRRGAGLGRDLLEAIIAVAVERGLTKVTAAMTPDQAGSLALFESMGFLPEAVLMKQVRDSAGGDHDLALLSLHLPGIAALRAPRVP